jgi:peroxiredoxin
VNGARKTPNGHNFRSIRRRHLRTLPTLDDRSGIDMKTYSKALLLLTSVFTMLLLSVPGHAAVGQRIGDFSLLDHQGKHHQLSWYSDQKAVVIFIQGNGCPIVRNGAPTLRAIRDDYNAAHVAFFMLNPQPQDNRHSIAQEATEYGYDMPILVDETQLVAESLGVDRTAEVYIIDPATRTILYQGPVDDRLGYETQKPEAKHHYLRDALDAVLAGKPVAKDIPEAPGCLVNFPARDKAAGQTISYTQDVVPILQQHCVSCHHDGGIGPWSMSSHAMVQGWSKMMKEVLVTRRMPPGLIDPHVGVPISNEADITPQEVQTLVHWIDAGAPMEEGAVDPLPTLEFENPKFTMSEPDIVLQVPPQEIPATGLIDYRYIPVSLNLEEDVWMRGMEFIPGDRQVLHHVIAYLNSPADKAVRGRRDTEGDRDSIGGFAPGRQPDMAPADSGRLLRKGSNLLLQMHYTTSGKETVDATEIGIYLHDDTPRYVMSGAVAGERRFMIPPHAKEHKLEGELLLERDAYLFSLMPHMHYRGRYMSYTAHYPDGTSQVLLSVPKYEFNWQFRYDLEEPLLLPAGTRLVAYGAMDNSAQNPGNPDPTVPVRFGLQTKHEMFFGFITLRYVGDTPESILGAEAATEEVAGL